jgi:hypothetical protein
MYMLADFVVECFAAALKFSNEALSEAVFDGLPFVRFMFLATRDAVVLLLFIALVVGFEHLARSQTPGEAVYNAQAQIDDLTAYLATLERRAESAQSALEWHQKTAADIASKRAATQCAIKEAQRVLAERQADAVAAKKSQ